MKMMKSKTPVFSAGVLTYTDLRAIRARRLEGWREKTHLIAIAGGAAAGDGAGGIFWADFSDTSTADDGSLVIVGADGVRFKRVTFATASLPDVLTASTLNLVDGDAYLLRDDTFVYLQNNAGGPLILTGTPVQVTSKAIFSAAIVGTESIVGSNSLDWSLANTIRKSISGDVTLTFTGATLGQWIKVRITSSGAYAVTWPTVKWAGGTPPTQTATGTDWYEFYYDGSSYYGSVRQAFA